MVRRRSRSSEKFPISEARAAGVKFGEMLAEFAAPVLLFLLFLHALVGYVELGTDSWITNIIEESGDNRITACCCWSTRRA